MSVLPTNHATCLTDSLNDYFDETFEKDSKTIDELEINYKTHSERLLQKIDSIITIPSKFLDAEKLKAKNSPEHNHIRFDYRFIN